MHAPVASPKQAGHGWFARHLPARVLERHCLAASQQLLFGSAPARSRGGWQLHAEGLGPDAHRRPARAWARVGAGWPHRRWLLGGWRRLGRGRRVWRGGRACRRCCCSRCYRVGPQLGRSFRPRCRSCRLPGLQSRQQAVRGIIRRPSWLIAVVPTPPRGRRRVHLAPPLLATAPHRHSVVSAHCASGAIAHNGARMIAGLPCTSPALAARGVRPTASAAAPGGHT